MKIDYHLNDHETFNGMYLISQGEGPVVDNPPQQYALPWVRSPYARVQLGAGSWTWIPNSRWVNEARGRYTRDYRSVWSSDIKDNPASYMFNGSTYHIYTGQQNPAYFGIPTITVQGFSFEIGGAPTQIIGPMDVFQALDHVSYLHSNHAFKFGGEILSNRFALDTTRTAKGVVQFPNLQSFFNGIPSKSSFLAGNELRHLSDWGFAAFLQDDWRVTPRLTLNLGLRYEIQTVLKESNNLLGNFDPVRGLEQVGEQISSPYNGEHYNFAPRLGLAWDIRGNGRTVIRASSNIIYEQLTFAPIIDGMLDTLGLRAVPTGVPLYASGLQQPGPGGTIATAPIAYSGSALTGTNAPGQLAFNWINNGPDTPLFQTSPTCGDDSPVANVIPPPQPCNVESVNRNLRTPYVGTWTLDIERAITNSLALDVAYIGNHGTKLLSYTDINQPQFLDGISPGWGAPTTPGSPAYNCLQSAPTYNNCSPSAADEASARPFNAKFPYLGYVVNLSNLDRSNYNALQATLTERPSHGLSFVTGYTYGHSLDDADGNILINWIPIYNQTPGRLYGNSDFDIRHRFTFSMTYAFPQKKSPLQILEGWSVNSIVTLESGLPWWVQDGGNDFSGTGEVNEPKEGQGEQWVFAGKPADFTMVHGFTQYNGGVGGIPYFIGSVPASCTKASTALGPLGLASLANSGCFALGNSVLVPPAYGTYGTTARIMFRDSGFHNWDFSISKNWRFKERLTAQFRAEFFNVLNHPEFANPYGSTGGGAASNDPSAGAGFACGCLTADTGASNPVLGSGGNRALQLGLKLIF